MKPLSGSGARGLMVDAMTTYGADSFVGRLACTMQGTTDTTFYIIAVYFGSVGIKNTRYAIGCGLLADLVGFTAAIFVAYLFFRLKMTNNFYDKTETYQLPVKDLTVEGEITNPGKVDFSAFPMHSVIVKETLLGSAGKDKFVGAYRYDGYSLFDILENRVDKKANADRIHPNYRYVR